MTAILDADIERQVKQTFLQESVDLLAQAEEGLLALERDPSDAETIVRIFRVAHTFKGSALSVGYEGVGRFCHWFEAILDLVRKKETPFDDALAGATLRALDHLRDEIAALREDPARERLTEADAVFLRELLDKRNGTPGATAPAPEIAPEIPRGKATQSATAHAPATHGTASTPAANASAGAAAEAASDAARQGPSQAELDAAARRVRSLTSNTALAETTGVIGHADSPLYKLFAFGDGPLPAGEPEAAVFARMSGETAIDHGLEDTQGFALGMLDSLRDHPAFAELKRVCVARWVGLTKRLHVVDSAVRGDDVVNTMPRGYSCYVRNGTSLLGLNGFAVRLYGDSGRILEQYRAERQLPQRSLRRVHLSGLRAGLCLPLRLCGRVAGYFFLNSSRVQAFDALPLSAVQVLSNVRRLAEAYVFDKGHPPDAHYLASFSGALALPHAAFDAHVFESALTVAAKRVSRDASVTLEADASLRFLYCAENAAYCIVRLAQALVGLGHPLPTVRVSLASEPLEIPFRVTLAESIPMPWENPDRDAGRLATTVLEEVALMCGFGLRKMEGGFALLLERDDPAEGLDYSC